MVVQHNIMALNSHRRLGVNNTAVGKNLEKLSSGYRINRAGDDAAGLAISEKMRAQIKGLEVAQRNAQDGISLVQTAEGALDEVHSMLKRMVELSTQAANGTYDDQSRSELQKEITKLNEEIDRIAEGTNFNDIKLLNGDLADQAYKVSGKTSTEVAATSSSSTIKVALANLTAAGPHEFTFNFSDGTSAKIEVKGDAGYTDAEKSAAAIQKELAKALSGKYDVAVKGADITLTSVETGSKAPTLLSANVGAGFAPVAATAKEGENKKIEIAVAQFNGANVYDGTQNPEDLMLNINGKKFLIAAANADLSKIDPSVVIVNPGANDNATGQALAERINQAFGNGEVAEYVTNGTKLVINTTEGGLELQVGDTGDKFNQLTVNVGNMDSKALGVADINISTVSGARTAIDKIKNAINSVSSTRSDLGAVQNRLEHTISNLSVAAENMTASESRIRDVDMAKEMMMFTQNNVLSQAAQAMLAQSNQQPQQILQLLR